MIDTTTKYFFSMLVCCLQRGRVVKSTTIDGERGRHSHGSKPTPAVMLCPWEQHCFLLGGLSKKL